MAPSSKIRQRLARLMDLRRAELHLRWDDVAETGRTSVATLRRIRNTDVEITADNEVAIEDGLDWARGSVARILAGDDPIPHPAHEPVDPVERAWDALRKAYEAERADSGPDPAWALLRRGIAKITELAEQRRERHAERERRETG